MGTSFLALENSCKYPIGYIQTAAVLPVQCTEIVRQRILRQVAFSQWTWIRYRFLTLVIYTGNAETGKGRDGLHSRRFSNGVPGSGSGAHVCHASCRLTPTMQNVFCI